MKKQLNLLLAIGLAAFVGCAEKTDLEKTLDTVNQQTIKDHVYFIASDEMRGRDTGSPEILKAADYLADQLKSYGAKPVPGADGYFQPVPFRKKTPATAGSFSYAGRNFNLNDDFLVVDGKSGSYEGEIVYLEYGLKEDYSSADVAGKLVFAKAGDGTTADRRAILRLSREKYDLAMLKGGLCFEIKIV